MGDEKRSIPKPHLDDQDTLQELVGCIHQIQQCGVDAMLGAEELALLDEELSHRHHLQQR